jgi:DNA adenine methylase
MRYGAFTHPGGKARLAKYIVPALPRHTCYVEAFCGSAAIQMNKERSQVEVLNDIDGEIANAFRCVRHHLDEVVRALDWRIGSREEFIRAREIRGQTDIQRAANFFYLKSLSFGADGKSFGVVRKSGGGASTSLEGIRAKLRLVSERLDGVVIENLDWHRCLKIYDSEETFFFFDPPYVESSVNAYAPWTIAQLKELVEAVKGIRGQWMITINDRPDVRRELRGLQWRMIERALGINNKTGAKRYRELIVQGCRRSGVRQMASTT